MLFMDICEVRRKETPVCGIRAVGNTGDKYAGFFQQQFNNQMRDNYKKRLDELFDQLNGETSNILEYADIGIFETYRRLIGELLSEIVENAYRFHAEYILDYSGKQKLYTSVSVIDYKLDEMAKEILRKSRDKISFLSRIDEIRGLITDLLF